MTSQDVNLKDSDGFDGHRLIDNGLFADRQIAPFLSMQHAPYHRQAYTVVIRGIHQEPET